ncbi:putative tripartite motif-containing protein 47 [Triplophysa rosa]|uniref:Tripartite motif-containing protein 47 n=1 Tax=Triplophysa rosa TaxID=992332 RepID=A0A9W7THZ6_TRIRA|nr:putative tripartite motif-containing protein 47 [Triplophysa rosa]
MAEACFSAEQFSCPVCLDLLSDPVAIPCGHSYCMSCITDCWNHEDLKGIYSCPQCRQTFTPRPALGKNTMLADVVEKLKKTKLRSDVHALCFAGPGDVECDVCTGRKQKAVKSCLVCLESYCQTHFELHEEFRPGKRHKMTDATAGLQEMICRQLLRQFCHIAVFFVLQRNIKETQRVIQDRIQQRQKHLQKLREAVKSHKLSAQTAVEDSKRIFTELIHSCQLTLDPNTVNKNLSLSERNRKITFTGTVQQYPDHPDRFDNFFQVLCRESVFGRWGDECGFGCNDHSWGRRLASEAQAELDDLEVPAGLEAWAWQLSCPQPLECKSSAQQSSSHDPQSRPQGENLWNWEHRPPHRCQRSILQRRSPPEPLPRSEWNQSSEERNPEIQLATLEDHYG